MNHIIESLERMEPQSRREELKRLLVMFQDRIPLGGWTPDCDWPRMEEVEERLVRDAAFFARLEELVGASPAIDKYRERFERNAAHMRTLTFDEHRYKRPAHEFFPLFDDMNKALQSHRGCSRIAWDDITFTTELIGQGGFSNIYKAYTADGTQLALKLFHLPHQRSRYDRYTGRFEWLVSRIMENLRENFNLLTAPHFARLMVVPEDSNYPWYLMEYSPGSSVKDRLETLSHEEKGTSMLAYAQMLSYLHERDVCFVDNNWGGVMLNNDSVKFVDYDLAKPIKNLTSSWKFAVRMYHPREHLFEGAIHTKNADLESFALMIDHLLVGNPFLAYDDGTHGYEVNVKINDAIKNNTRKYPSLIRGKEIPQHLRQVVVPLINLPRDESITAEDFVSAIKLDYGL